MSPTVIPQGLFSPVSITPLSFTFMSGTIWPENTACKSVSTTCSAHDLFFISVGRTSPYHHSRGVMEQLYSMAQWNLHLDAVQKARLHRRERGGTEYAKSLIGTLFSGKCAYSVWSRPLPCIRNQLMHIVKRVPYFEFLRHARIRVPFGQRVPNSIPAVQKRRCCHNIQINTYGRVSGEFLPESSNILLI